MERTDANRGPWSQSRPPRRRRNCTSPSMNGPHERFLNRVSQVRILPGAPGQSVEHHRRTPRVERFVERHRCCAPRTPPSGSTRRKRQRGAIETLPSGALRVHVYAGIDPLSGKKHHLVEVIPAGKDAAKLADVARTRLLNRSTRSAAAHEGHRRAAHGALPRGPADRGHDAGRLRRRSAERGHGGRRRGTAAYGVAEHRPQSRPRRAVADLAGAPHRLHRLLYRQQDGRLVLAERTAA